ncbi:MAG: hypothetical protein EAX91_02410 [Candidatus Lokiarchaeota archaeon]|nr:hypothetical protein [Candidatus Lokiarchaeota archaeon]
MSQKDFQIIQLSYVYKDIEKQAQILETSFGMPKFSYHEYINAPIIYRDKKAKVTLKCAKSRLLNSYTIELIQLISGEDNLYYEFLNKGREGLHHIDVLVFDIEKYIEFFIQKGFKVVQKGKSMLRWVYLDTDALLGFMIELVEGALPKRKRQ